MNHDDFCKRCGCCSVTFVDCWQCGGDGETQPGELYEEDPLWYDQDAVETCNICHGKGGWPDCLGNCDDNGKHEKKDEAS